MKDVPSRKDQLRHAGNQETITMDVPCPLDIMVELLRNVQWMRQA